MKKVFLFSLLNVFLTTLLVFTPFASAAYPKPQGYVSDFANVLSPLTKQAEEKKLSDFKEKTTNEIALVMVNTTGDMSIEDYTQGLADQWKPGVSGKDNGIIILFAMEDHHDRIAIGCGLEGVFTDVDAEEILGGETQVSLRQGDVNKAVDITTDEVIKKLGNSTPQPCKVGSQKAIDDAQAATADNSGGGTSGGEFGLWLLVIVIIIIAILAVIGFASEHSDDIFDDDDTPGGGFGTGVLAGGVSGYGLGRSIDNTRTYTPSSYTPRSYTPSRSSYSSPSNSSSSSSSSSSHSSFGGFSGGSFSGGGASGGW